MGIKKKSTFKLELDQNPCHNLYESVVKSPVCHRYDTSLHTHTYTVDKVLVITLGGVHKLGLQEEGGMWSKKSTFCKLLYHRKCKQRGVGGQK